MSGNLRIRLSLNSALMERIEPRQLLSAPPANGNFNPHGTLTLADFDFLASNFNRTLPPVWTVQPDGTLVLSGRASRNDSLVISGNAAQITVNGVAQSYLG